MKTHYLKTLICIFLFFGALPTQAQTNGIDLSKAKADLVASKLKRCEAKKTKYQKRVDNISERLKKHSGKSSSLFWWKVWYSWRISRMENRLNRLELKYKMDCPPANEPEPIVTNGTPTKCTRCQRVGTCACKGIQITYRPCDLYAEIVERREIKNKLTDSETPFIDYFAFKDLQRVINNELIAARKKGAIGVLAKDVGLTVNGPSVSATSSPNAETATGSLTSSASVETMNEQDAEKIMLQIIQLVQDSTDLANSFIGGQNFTMGNITSFQNFANVPDDNPQQITQFNFNYSLPLKKLNGKMVCNYRKPFTHIWFRNLYFTSALTPVTVASKLFVAKGIDTTFDSRKGIYANYLDLYQYSRLRANMNINVYTYISRYYSVYANTHLGVGRTEVQYGSNSTTLNYYDYGINFTLRTKFKTPLNAIASYYLYLLDVNSDIIIPNLNRQYSQLYKSNDAYYRLSTKNSQFNTFNITFQYDLRSINTNDDAGTGNNNSTAPTFLYASISYNTNRMVGARYNKQAHNNFLTVQLGYSRSFNEFADAVKSLLGIGKSQNTVASE